MGTRIRFDTHLMPAGFLSPRFLQGACNLGQVPTKPLGFAGSLKSQRLLRVLNPKCVSICGLSLEWLKPLETKTYYAGVITAKSTLRPGPMDDDTDTF
jgi:hypothetical protein